MEPTSGLGLLLAVGKVEKEQEQGFIEWCYCELSPSGHCHGSFSFEAMDITHTRPYVNTYT